MNNQEMKDALLAANTALVEKIGKQPYIRLSLTLNNERWCVGSAYFDDSMREHLSGPQSDDPDGAFIGVMEAIRKMPSEAERDLREFHKKVAEAIDFGNEHGIDGEWLNPLTVMSRKLAENALTYSEARK